MKTINRLASFIKADHRYVYLGTSVIAALGLAASQRNPTPLSFLAPTGVFQDCLWAILWAWIAVSAAALTVYDMCKAVQKDMRITNIRLLEKSGGKSGDYRIKE